MRLADITVYRVRSFFFPFKTYTCSCFIAAVSVPAICSCYCVPVTFCCSSVPVYYCSPLNRIAGASYCFGCYRSVFVAVTVFMLSVPVTVFLLSCSCCCLLCLCCQENSKNIQIKKTKISKNQKKS